MRSLAVLLFTLSFAAAANGFVASGNYWEAGQATFRVGISGSSPTGGSWNAAFKRSMDAWTNATDFQFIAIDDFHDPCIERGTGQFGDGTTGVDFTTTVCGAEYGGATVAVTLSSGVCSSPACTTFHITDSDIVFNIGESWDVYSGNLRFSFIDFERVALHELGHALGLNHEVSSDAIMQPVVSNSNSLQTDDINGANAIYGGEVTFPSIYSVDIVQPTISVMSGPITNVNFSGNLAISDASLDGKFIDLYQYTFENDSSIDIQVNSSELDTLLYVARVSSTQSIIPGYLFSDDNSAQGSNSRIIQDIQAGTYWIGVSSAGNSEQGNYDVSMSAVNQEILHSFESFTSIYGADVEINPNPNVKGSLAGSDFEYDSKFLDLYQFEITQSIDLRFDLSSEEFDTTLILVEVDSNQGLKGPPLVNDDNGITTNSRIEQTLAAGTYWMGVTSFGDAETGDYNINVTVIIP